MTWHPYLERVGLPVVSTVLLLLLWEALVRYYKVPVSLLPAPSMLYERFLQTYPTIFAQAIPTTIETLLGFVLATILGMLLAIALTYSRLLDAALYPGVIFFQLIPKIALAPLFIVWLGIGTESRLAFSIFISFFPIVVATMAGLRSTPPEMLRLCHALTATKWQLFILVRLPFAVPYIFSGMKIAVTFAMIGVIIGEFITAQRGLGFIIIFASSQADTALILVAIAMLCVVGLGLYGVVALVERMVARIYGSA